MKISVITPVYNAEDYISQAVESALQFPEVYEVVLVEDNSPDNALAVCEELEKKYDRVKLFRHPNGENRGAGASRNLGLEKATGDFIAFLDADDYYLPNRFDAEKELFINPEVDAVYGALGVEYYSEKAKDQFYSLFQDKLLRVYDVHPPENVFPGLIYLKGAFGLFSVDCLTIRKASLDTLKYGFFKTSLRLHQDSEFIMRASYYLNFYPGILDKAVAVRGVHEDNRITKVDSKKVKPAKTRFLLWESLLEWAMKEDIEEQYLNQIKRFYKSYYIGNLEGVKKYLIMIKELVLDPQLLRRTFRRNF